MEADHAIAHLELLHAGADLSHRAGQLVAENLRRREEPVMNLLDVRAADAAGAYTEQHLARTDLRNGDSLDDDAVFAPINARAHRAVELGGIVRSDLWDGLAHGSLLFGLPRSRCGLRFQRFGPL